MNERTVTCTCCGAEVRPEDALYVDASPLCQDCADEETFVCDNCGFRHWNTENAGDGCYDLCESCRDEYFVECSECGRLLHNYEAYYTNRDEDGEFPYTEIDSSYLDQVGEQQLHMAANFESGVYDFIQMCCTLAPDAFVPSGELYRHYQSYTQANGRPAYTKTDTFSRVLCRLYPILTPTKRYVEGKQCRCLEGIMLSAPSETNQHQKEESSHD